MFVDRFEAGRRLAEALAHLAEENAVVLGVPRGGVEVAGEVARSRGWPLDIVIPRKIRAPFNPELGLGAIAPGVRVLDESMVRTLGVSEDYLEQEIALEEEEIRRRTEAYRRGRPPVDVNGKVAVVVDDGVATGGTAAAALRWARAEGASRVVLAIPVAPREAVIRLSKDADEVVCLGTPEPFFAVGQWYERFPQTSAHALAKRLADVRKAGVVPYLRPDGKCQVTIEYEDGRPIGVHTILISAQHRDEVDRDTLLTPDMEQEVIEPVLHEFGLDAEGVRVLVNPTGRFEIGGPKADTGLTGRKIMVDSYGGMAPHGGGCFSGKDPTKVDRSAAYMGRYVAKNIVAAGLAERVQTQVAYAIGASHPVSFVLETFGTSEADPRKIEEAVLEVFDFRPAAIIDALDLRRPIYRETACYGHFGRKGFSWEDTDRAEDLRRALA